MKNLPSPTSLYPSKVDSFKEVQDGDSDVNIIHAVYINKIQNAIVALENNLRYTPSGLITSGPLLYTVTVERTLQARTPGIGRRLIEISVDLDPSIVRKYFNNAPFQDQYGLRTSAVAYRNERRSGRVTRVWHRVQSAARVEASQNLQLSLGILKTNDEWKPKDRVQAVITIERQ